MDGSSAATTTSPPFAPVMAELMKASDATFSPTCFMQTMARLPANDIPRAASMAVFSLQLQRARIPRSCASADCWIYSVISVDGVPGYAKTPEIPASIAACAIASSPSQRFVFTVLIYLAKDLRT